MLMSSVTTPSVIRSEFDPICEYTSSGAFTPVATPVLFRSLALKFLEFKFSELPRELNPVNLFEPILLDRYIFFVLIPIICLLSHFVFQINSKFLRYLL